MKSLSLINIILCLITIACNEKKDGTKRSGKSENHNRFANVTRVVQIGDSVRIEIEEHNGMSIKHYIDLKGISDDGFDNSYNVICRYNQRNVDSTIVFKKQRIRIKELLNEHYESKFSAGTNYYMITEMDDTILINHILDYIR